LGVSRPHLVALLKAGQIPYTFAGKHRRVAINDLLEYMAKRAGQGVPRGAESYDEGGPARPAYTIQCTYLQGIPLPAVK
jgi:excisionase family DNA binding protein